MDTEFWNTPFELENGKCCAITLGPVTAWVKRLDKELHTALIREDSPDAGYLEKSMDTECTRDVDWTRYYASNYSNINVLPALPDLPLILISSGEIKFLPGEEASYFIRLPLWFQILAEEKQKQEVIIDSPVTILSRTWSGAPSTGFICYFLDRELWTGDPIQEADPFVVYCPITIQNESKKLVNLNRICLHAENLSVFSSFPVMITNTLTITIRGDSERVQLADRPSKTFKGAKRVGKPRVKVSDNILSKSFSLIRQVTISD